MDNHGLAARLGDIGGEVGNNEVFGKQMLDNLQRQGVGDKLNEYRIEIQQIKNTYVLCIRVEALNISGYTSPLAFYCSVHEALTYVDCLCGGQHILDDAVAILREGFFVGCREHSVTSSSGADFCDPARIPKDPIKWGPSQCAIIGVGT